MGFYEVLQKRFSALLATHCSPSHESGGSHLHLQWKMTLGLSGIWVFPPSVMCSSGWLRHPMGCQGTCSTKVSKKEITSDVQLKQNQKQAQRSQFSVEFLSVWGSTPNYFKLVCILQIHKLKKGGGDCLLKNSHHFQWHKNKKLFILELLSTFESDLQLGRIHIYIANVSSPNVFSGAFLNIKIIFKWETLKLQKPFEDP